MEPPASGSTGKIRCLDAPSKGCEFLILVSEQLKVPDGNLFESVAKTPAVQSLVQRVEKGSIVSCQGIPQGAHGYLAVLVRHLFPEHTIVLVTDGIKRQESVHQDLETLLTTAKIASPNLFFPSWEILPHESKLPHVDVISDRLQTLLGLVNRQPGLAPIVTTTVTALAQKTFPPAMLAQRSRSVRRGESVDPLDLVEWLEENGYEPEAQVNHKGELALRGGILDIFPTTSLWPLRLEFFGNEIESIRYFDPITQMSREQIEGDTITPAGEIGILKKTQQALSTLLDYLGDKAIVLLCEPELLDHAAREYEEQLPSGDAFSISWAELQQRLANGPISALKLTEHEDAEEAVNLHLSSLESFRPIPDRPPELHIAEEQRREFFGQMHRWLRQEHVVHVFCNTEGDKQRFAELWTEYGFADESGQLSPQLHLGSLSRGFLSEGGKLVVVTEAEIVGRFKVQRPRRLKSAHAQTTRSLLEIDFTDLHPGDYVVHIEHGIGRYVGLQVLGGIGGLKPLEKAKENPGGEECMVIEYAPSSPEQPAPKLYVAVTEAHLVSKYVGTGKAQPPLNTLGGGRWAKAKEQAERAVRDLASELLAVQAARESEAGHAFPGDVTWQREFEAAFVFEETPDQLRAISQTKADMERPKPMDRLICGDVGFGKTEVAIRAAFKAVMGGKQVAVLVPTTVLAQQHYNTFTERMAEYPVRIDLLSRFRTPRQQRKTIQGLAEGAVDIVIGTHRLVQDDISFKDLGLVVIDEEQRFGVLHKEKFKLLRKLVDVLTLSATPIPRTLHLALTGARDMSTIETPPQDRLPVETIVTQYDERVIRDAIQRELNRQGQVFFLHNRVSTINDMALKLHALVPKARIVVGHGQMDADELEDVMTRFVNGEADVLLSTTIIESGLDIPNANTIIIDRADRFGLSDLYQLRGRVGRYKHQAYAYLLIPRHAGLLSDARKRITAIKQYSTLGSGFKIAMRDLEIRGAGNLLGAQQSGHITAVGFELYCQLLKQSISSLKGEKVKKRVHVEISLDFLSAAPADAPRGASLDDDEEDAKPLKRAAGSRPMGAYIPFKYISDSHQRIQIYRKIAEISDAAGLKAIETELRDRFGPLPEPLQLLLATTELKLLAHERGVTHIETKDDKLMLTRNNDYIMFAGKFPRLTKPNAKGRLGEIKRLLRQL